MPKSETHHIATVDVDIESWVRSPAVTSRPELYLIKGKNRIGKVRVGNSRSRSNGLIEYVSINPDDEATREYFQDDEMFQKTGMLFLKFDGVFGDRWLTIQDGDEPRYTDLRVVDKLAFDFGISHPFFSDVEGFDNYHKEQNRLRIHTKHKARKPRDSRKIKKVQQLRYFYVEVGGSSTEYREELFSQVQYIDIYKWYVNLDGTESDRGDHDIAIQTTDKRKLREIISQVGAKHQYVAEIYELNILDTRSIHTTIQRLNEKYK